MTFIDEPMKIGGFNFRRRPFPNDTRFRDGILALLVDTFAMFPQFILPFELFAAIGAQEFPVIRMTKLMRLKLVQCRKDFHAVGTLVLPFVVERPDVFTDEVVHFEILLAIRASVHVVA